MAFVLDASFAAAWLIAEEHSAAAEAVIATLQTPCQVPTLFWFEIRNILVMCERRGRMPAGSALVSMERVRRLPLEDAGAGGDSLPLLLAGRHGLTAYDASYLALSLNRSLPIATLDRRLAAAATAEAVRVLGPFAHAQ